MKIFFAVSPIVVGFREECLPPQVLSRIALVVLLHLALLWLFTAPVHMPVVPDNRVWVQLLHPEAPPILFHKKITAESAGDPHSKVTLPARRLSAAPIATQEPPIPTSVPAVQVASTLMSDIAEEHAAEPAAAKAAASTLPVDVVQQALKSAGAIDRQLRSEHRQEFSAPPNTPRARLVKGLEAAHAAVRPKWFEAARTELISAPNDPKRIYRVTTPMGEYCLYFPDKGSISANSDPKSGWAGFGQATAAGCPIPF